ncbi:hypothetical protein BwSF19_75940 [Bradyrhizobium ottawaense]|nr:hypothetical protein BwSF19_75940 [Bradyrhizobium ottawaense]
MVTRRDQVVTGETAVFGTRTNLITMLGGGGQVGLTQCKNVLGGDNYHPDHSHVPAALIRRFHEAKLANATSVSVWGTGTPLREFLNVDDFADACVFLLKNYSSDLPINVGSGDELSIADFARTVAEVVGYQGELAFDASKPDGTPRKLLDSSRIRGLGWRPNVALRAGLAAAYADFLKGSGRHLEVSATR